MNIRALGGTILLLTISGCVLPTVPNEAHKWTLELTSSDPIPNGPCRIYDESHRLMLDGQLVSGMMDGTWTSTGSDGTRLAIWPYRQGVLHGSIKMWYGGLAYPDAKGQIKIEGTFVDGFYHGVVTRYYPSGSRECIRNYEHGILKSSEAWLPNGSAVPPSNAMREANFEDRQDKTYLNAVEDMVKRSLVQAHREIKR